MKQKRMSSKEHTEINNLQAFTWLFDEVKKWKEKDSEHAPSTINKVKAISIKRKK